MKNGFPAPNKELAKTKNNHLTGKAPYKFESVLLQRRVRLGGQLRERATSLSQIAGSGSRRRAAGWSTLAFMWHMLQGLLARYHGDLLVRGLGSPVMRIACQVRVRGRQPSRSLSDLRAATAERRRLFAKRPVALVLLS
jgi:hypothetical protein